MNTVDKDELEKLRKFFSEHPEEARKFISENPDLLNYINKNSNNNQGNNSVSESKSESHSYGGVVRTKSIPGIPRMFDWDDNNQGFSNYLMLSILAFSIQFIITLICIFFYK